MSDDAGIPSELLDHAKQINRCIMDHRRQGSSFRHFRVIEDQTTIARLLYLDFIFDGNKERLIYIPYVTKAFYGSPMTVYEQALDFMDELLHDEFQPTCPNHIYTEDAWIRETRDLIVNDRIEEFCGYLKQEEIDALCAELNKQKASIEQPQ